MGVAVHIFLGTELSTKFTLSGVRAVDKIKRQRGELETDEISGETPITWSIFAYLQDMIRTTLFSCIKCAIYCPGNAGGSLYNPAQFTGPPQTLASS